MKRAAVTTSALIVALSLALPTQSMEGRRSRQEGGRASAASTDTLTWCSLGPTPCIEAATRDGVPVLHDDPDYEINLLRYNEGKSRFLRWILLDRDTGSNQLPGELGHVWSITIQTGAIEPRVVFSYGENATVERARSPNRVTVTAEPTRLTDNDECSPTWPWSCPRKATKEFNGYLDSLVTNYNAWTPLDQREAFYGMNYSTNIGMTSLPPEVVPDPDTGAQRLLIRLANHHLFPDDTVFRGFAHLRIPNPFLRRVYGIDDPATLTGAGLETAGTGGAATVAAYQETGGGAMRVDITGMTFSRRRVRISRGVITPTRPRNVRAKRSGATVGRVRFDPAKPRGSKITSYQARCVRGASVVTASRRRSPVVVKGLQPGTRYQCRVRARSKAGFGAWSKGVRMPARA